MLLSSLERSNKNATQVLDLLAVLDRDGDGTVTFKEFMANAYREPIIMSTLEALFNIRGNVDTMLNLDTAPAPATSLNLKQGSVISAVRQRRRSVQGNQMLATNYRTQLQFDAAVASGGGSGLCDADPATGHAAAVATDGARAAPSPAATNGTAADRGSSSGGGGGGGTAEDTTAPTTATDGGTMAQSRSSPGGTTSGGGENGSDSAATEDADASSTQSSPALRQRARRHTKTARSVNKAAKVSGVAWRGVAWSGTL